MFGRKPGIALFFIILIIISALMSAGCRQSKGKDDFSTGDPFLLIIAGQNQDKGTQSLGIFIIQFSEEKKVGNIVLIPKNSEMVVSGVEEQYLEAAYIYGGGQKVLEVLNKELKLGLVKYFIIENDDMDSWIGKVGNLEYEPKKEGSVFIEENMLQSKDGRVSLTGQNVIDLLMYLNQLTDLNKPIFAEKLSLFKSFIEINLSSRYSRENGSFILHPSETNLEKDELPDLNKAFISLQAEKISYNYLAGKEIRVDLQKYWKIDKKKAAGMVKSLKEGKSIKNLFQAKKVEKKESEVETETVSPEKEQEPPPVDKAVYKVAVLNGNGKPGQAEKVAQQVRTAGWKVAVVENAPNFNYNDSLVFFRQNHQQAAQLLSKDIGISQVWPVKPEIKEATELIVIVGRDKL